MAVSAELNVDASLVARLGKRIDHGCKIHFALAKHQMLMDSSLHVLEVDIHQHLSPTFDIVRQWHLAEAVQVSDIQR